jgi:hypothetical protein
MWIQLSKRHQKHRSKNSTKSFNLKDHALIIAYTSKSRITLIKPFKWKGEIGKKTMKNMESWLGPIIKVEID